MKISFKGDYALKIILDLSLTYGQGLTQIPEVAKRQDIPEKYLEQIVTILKGAKFIKTQRGPKGGISLTKPPNQITLGEIIRLVEGPTSPVTCVSKSCYAKCNFESKCVFKGIWEEVRNKINDVVDKTTFEDMVEKNNKMNRKNTIDYVI